LLHEHRLKCQTPQNLKWISIYLQSAGRIKDTILDDVKQRTQNAS